MQYHGCRKIYHAVRFYALTSYTLTPNTVSYKYTLQTTSTSYHKVQTRQYLTVSDRPYCTVNNPPEYWSTTYHTPRHATPRHTIQYNTRSTLHNTKDTPYCTSALYAIIPHRQYHSGTILYTAYCRLGDTEKHSIKIHRSPFTVHHTHHTPYQNFYGTANYENESSGKIVQ
jgi:hypothetical protein